MNREEFIGRWLMNKGKGSLMIGLYDANVAYWVDQYEICKYHEIERLGLPTVNEVQQITAKWDELIEEMTKEKEDEYN